MFLLLIVRNWINRKWKRRKYKVKVRKQEKRNTWKSLFSEKLLKRRSLDVNGY